MTARLTWRSLFIVNSQTQLPAVSPFLALVRPLLRRMWSRMGTAVTSCAALVAPLDNAHGSLGIDERSRRPSRVSLTAPRQFLSHLSLSDNLPSLHLASPPPPAAERLFGGLVVLLSRRGKVCSAQQTLLMTAAASIAMRRLKRINQ